GRRGLTRLKQVFHLEATRRSRHGTIRIGEVAVRVSVEVRQRVVRVGALDAEVERVVGVELLERASERDRVLARELRDAVLHLERVVAQQVVWRERLVAERRVCAACSVADDDKRERRHLSLIAAALVLVREADEQVVREVAEYRVPFADWRPQVLENLVIRVGEGEELRRVLLTGRAER